MRVYQFPFSVCPQSAQCVSLIWSLLLPSVGISLYFYNQSNQTNLSNPSLEESDTDNYSETSRSGSSDLEDDKVAGLELGRGERNQKPAKRKFSATAAFSLIASHVKTSYSNAVVVQWSLWWAVSMCGFLQVTKITLFHNEIQMQFLNFQISQSKGAIVHTAAVEGNRCN